MSQNSHTLLLFFDKEEHYKNCFGQLKQLALGADDKAKAFAKRAGVDFAQSWNDDWFNHSITPTPRFLRLDYDSSTHYELPLDVLYQLFSSGLRAACLETFNDQVGEFYQFYFLEGQLVEKETAIERFPKIEAIVEEQFESDSEDLEEDGYHRPCSIKKLMENTKKHKEESKEMVDALVNLSKFSRETGENPIELIKSAMVVRALIKALVHAAGFGLTTILLFKGMWLWITVTLLLIAILPVIYVSKINKEFGYSDEDNKEEGGKHAN